MRGIHFSTIKKYQSLRADIDTIPLEQVMMFDDRFPLTPTKHQIVSRRLPAMSAEELAEWKLTGLTNFAIVELIYEKEVEK